MKKIVVILVVLSMMLFTMSCSKDLVVNVITNDDKVYVNDEITFNILVQNAYDVCSCGFQLIYDTNSFDLVSGEMCMDADISDFSDSIGVLAFSNPVDIKDTSKIMTFRLKAKNAVKNSVVSCKASFKGSDDQSISVSAVYSSSITVKA